ncbi:MAG: hypothetical protein CMP10_20450 [Zetaproteobacteria bacterium]|nr:hypothetical protein [Pseudobdellovibrionaceae bacterium]
MAHIVHDDLLSLFGVGRHQIPGIWRFLLPEDAHYFQFPSEEKSTCHSCPQVKLQGFHPKYGCCTYHPRIPNYQLGFALSDMGTQSDEEKGLSPRYLVSNLISKGFLLPEGMQHSPVMFQNSLEQQYSREFGQNSKVLCPFLRPDTSQCGNYAYRNSVCATFFCESDYGKDSEKFWRRMQSLMGQLETSLCQWAMKENNIDPEGYFLTFNSLKENISECSNPDGSWSDKALDMLWGPWRGQEAEFFLKCAGAVRENKEKLYELASSFQIHDAQDFELAFRDSLPPVLQKEMDDEGLIIGKPAAVEDLWYGLKVAQSHLARQIPPPDPDH